MDSKDGFSCFKRTVIIFAIFICSAFYEGSSMCHSSWFGDYCKYKCHCKGDNCTSEGNCPLGCKRGWFGPQCQYVNLVDEIRNSNIGCEINESTNPAFEIPLSRPTVFTWMRLEFKEEPETFHWKLLKNDDLWTNCNISKVVRVTSVIFDLFCDDTKRIIKAILLNTSKPNVLCNVYVSGGRNVVLKAIAKQTSTFSNLTYDETYGLPEHAVDGSTASNYSDKSCSHTQNNGKKISQLELEFSNLSWIHSYRLYKEIHQAVKLTYTVHLLDAYKERFDSFEMEMNDLSNFHVHIPEESARFVRIRNKHCVLLCEIEVFGDTECPSGLYGRECGKQCNCFNQSESCQVSTGGCVSGCLAGYRGEDCSSPCPLFFYGPECRLTFSNGCGSQGRCQFINGNCLERFKNAYTGSYCSVALSFSPWTHDITITIGVGTGLCIFVVSATAAGLVMYVLKQTANRSSS